MLQSISLSIQMSHYPINRATEDKQSLNDWLEDSILGIETGIHPCGSICEDIAEETNDLADTMSEVNFLLNQEYQQ